MPKKEKTELEKYLDNYFPEETGFADQDAEAIRMLVSQLCWIFDFKPNKAKEEVRRYMEAEGLLTDSI
jgi:hypothetical protein